MLRKVRISSQVVFFAVFIILFFLFDTFRMESGSSGLAWYLRLNPFITVLTSLAARSIVVSYFILGIVMLLLTLVFGRAFCGMVCPLGSIIDYTDSIFRGKEKKKQPLRPSKKLQGLKYIVLIAAAVMAIFGLTFPLFLDPLLLVTRLFTLVVRPVLLLVQQFIPGMNTKELLSSPLVMQGAYTGAGATAALFFIILLGALFDRRFWCQYVCPSGAFFGLLSRFSLFTRTTHVEKCNNCSICAEPRCPTRSISGENFNVTSTAECILCGQCSLDKRMCSSFSFKKNDLAHTIGTDLKRRHLVSGIVSGLVIAPVFANKSRKKKPFVPGPIRPPGAVEESVFLSRCITCDACVSVCPQNALHPCTIGADRVINWNTPKLVPRIGYCEEECTRCSEACPTGALLPVTQEEKAERKIGTAYVERGICRSWRMQYKCIICARKCPYEAIDKITIENEDGREFEVPVVNKRKCTGCGICEYKCPLKSESAIKVSSYGEKRIKVRKKRRKPKSKKT